MPKVDNESLIDLGKQLLLSFFLIKKKCQFYFHFEVFELFIQNNSLKMKIALRVISN